MKDLIVYSSRETGNSRKIAETLVAADPSESVLAPAAEAPAAGAAPVQTGNDEAVAAVIAAVVLPMWEGPGELVIRSIRRAGATESLWAQAGRQDLMK